MAGVLIDMFGMQAIFWYSHFFNAACLFMILAFVPSSLFHKKAQESAAPGSAHDSPEVDVEDPKQPISNPQNRHGQSLSVQLRKFLGDGRQFLRSPLCRVVLIDALFYGLVMTVPDTYLFICLEKDYKASKTVNGLFTLLSTLSCLPLFWYSDRLISRFGHHRVMYIAKCTCVARLAACALLPPAWPVSLWLLGVSQLAHGPNFALFWAAAVDLLHRAAPPGLAASSLAALNLAYFTAAGAVAGVVWGPVYDALGGWAVFAAAAVTEVSFTWWFADCRRLIDAAAAAEEPAQASGGGDAD
jgi:hypothetical protein